MVSRSEGKSKLTQAMLAAKFGEVELEVFQGGLPRLHSSDTSPASAASQQILAGVVCGLVKLTETYPNVVGYFYREYFY